MIKKGDFIELNYTGIIKNENIVFDTTIKEVAEKNNIFEKHASYEPIIICVGENHVLKGIDDFIIGKEFGKYTIELKPEEAFGKKTAKLIQLIPTSKFKGQDIIPQPGLQVNVDGYVGIIKTVSGGRTIVDFNHPLAGKDLIYEVELIKKVEDKVLQIKSLCSIMLGQDRKNIDVILENNNAKIKLKHKLPEAVTNELKNKIKELVSIDVEFQ